MKMFNTILFHNQINSFPCTSRYSEDAYCTEATAFQPKPKTRNEVELAGTIISYRYNGKAAVMNLRTLGKHEDCLKILFFAESMDAVKSFGGGDLVKIKGHIQTKRFDPQAPDAETSFVVGNAISPLTYEEAEALKDSRYSNRMCLKGEVVHVHREDKLLHLVIKTGVNGRKQFVPTCYYLSAENEFTGVMLGDLVSVKGSVQSREQTTNGITERFQNFVIRCGTILHREIEELVA